ncbi:hypothetical protein EJP02_066 [Escherichia phage EJP2]|nr:hypothetical protein EJP02_066 [Escherichia phage EJP2]
MNVITTESGDVQDVLTRDAFKIHNMMFNIKEVVQCLFYCSKTMHDFFHSDMCDMFVCTVNRDESFIMGMPMSVNAEYNECVLRNNPGSSPQRDLHVKKNTYCIKGDDIVIMFLTKGFILDNFTVKESYHDFRVQEDNPTVMIYASDIESLAMDNPGVM